MIGLEYNGVGVAAACQTVIQAVCAGSTGLAFSSATPQEGAQQVENFFNYADMQMNA